jgi:hypothetical protein
LIETHRRRIRRQVVVGAKKETRSLRSERVSLALAEYLSSARKLTLKSALILAE